MSAELKSSKLEKNKKVAMTNRALLASKEMKPLMSEYLKIVQRYQAALKTVYDIGKQLSEATLKISAVSPAAEMQKELNQLADVHKMVEARRGRVAQAWNDDLYVPISRSLDPLVKDASSYEKKFKTDRSTNLKTIRKNESTVLKLTKKKKKTQAQIDAAVSRLDASVTDHEEMLSQQLRAARSLYRKAWTDFFTCLNTTLVAEVELTQEMAAFEKVCTSMEELAGLGALPDEEVETEIERAKKATTDRMAQMRQSVYGGSPIKYDNDEEEEEDDEEDEEDEEEDEEVEEGDLLVCVYPYAGQSEEELTISNGDRIKLVEKADEEWYYGSCNGADGYFPISCVKKL